MWSEIFMSRFVMTRCQVNVLEWKRVNADRKMDRLGRG